MKLLATINLMVLAVCSCGPNQRIMNSAAEDPKSPVESNSTIAPAASSFDQDLNAMHTADFSFIYVIRRRDGGVLDQDDKGFIGRTTPKEMNRRRLSDSGKALIIGSNFRLAPENVAALKERFVFEDHSRNEGEGRGKSDE